MIRSPPLLASACLVVLAAVTVAGEGSAEESTALVYTVDKCKYCAEVKAFLKEKGIKYEEKQLGNNKKVWSEMQKKAMGCCKDEVKKVGKPEKVLVLAPQIFINDKWAGTHRKAGEFGKLQAELDKAAGKAVAPWTEEAADNGHAGGIDDDDECNKCPSGEFHFEETDEGSVEVLTDENFDSTTKDGFWLVEFYAPWCQHCAKLAPIYAEASDAEGIAGFMNMAKIDATKPNHKALAKKLGVTGFPRLFWRRDGGEFNKYNGGKSKLEDFTSFAARMKQPAVSAEEPAATEEEPVYFHLSLENEEARKGPLATAFTGAARGLQDQLRFSASVGGGATTVTRLQLGDSRRGDSYAGEAALEPLLAWIKNRRFPDLISLGKKNFKHVTREYRGGLVAIGVYDPADKAGSDSFKKTLGKIAAYSSTALSVETKKRVAVGTLDGAEWEKYVETFGVSKSDLPAMFVLEAAMERSYFTKGLGATEAAMAGFIDDVVAGKVAPKYGTLGKLFEAEGVVGVIQQYPWLVAVAIAVVFVLYGVYTVATSEDEVEEEEPKKEK